jgi:manganese/zinc/iron transport system permease protein
VGLKIVGLILIVALLIIPPVTARFWTNRVGLMIGLSGTVGGLSGYVGAALSATAPNLPTGPLIVLICFGLFLVSLLFSPLRGVLAQALRRRRVQVDVHVRQGLLALAQNQPIYESYTRRLLQRRGFLRADGVATEDGLAEATRAIRNEHRWSVVRADPAYAMAFDRYDGLTDVEDVLTSDQIADIDAQRDRAIPVDGPR